MENPTVSELRSRSRSKTPFLRSSCDRENCTEGEEHTHHKSGRKTPSRRSTPIKQIEKIKTADFIEVIQEENPPAHRKRQSTRQSGKLMKTSDYSSEESLDRLKGRHGKEIFQIRVCKHLYLSPNRREDALVSKRYVRRGYIAEELFGVEYKD
ncbi:jg13633 [Pararge aegeria aegeria]|uniref:Jg13633 protein n=1 Tax=Pararge aegeria aegeria TaxID=348720 RepID=A0A8S4S5G4_9NEOP|nr:jg13633 [Pararge aegeria aegeria]